MALVPQQDPYSRIGQNIQRNLAPPVSAPLIDVTSVNRQRIQGFDLIGPILRRKYIVILFAILGGIAGLVYYLLAPPEFASAARIMIWSQAPPNIVDGETVTPSVPIIKHVNLIRSQLVLAQAIQEGQLEKMDALVGEDPPLEILQENFVVKNEDEFDDTLVLTVRGPDPDELPAILNEIVKAFTSTLSENTRNFGEESIELIKKLQVRMIDDKDAAEKRYIQMLKNLGVTKQDEQGNVENPFADRLDSLYELRDEQQLTLRDVIERIAQLTIAVGSNEETVLRAAAVEAKEYLSLSYSPSQLNSNVSRDIVADRGLVLMMENLQQRTLVSTLR